MIARQSETESMGSASRGRTGRVRAVPLLLSSLLAGACATLPTSGPTSNQILREELSEANRIGFAILDITAETLPPEPAGPNDPIAALEALDRPGRVDLLGPGDVLQIELFEVGVALFGSTSTMGGSGQGEGFAPQARAQQLGVVVDRDGRIHLPYVGSLAVAGRTTEDVQAMIVRGLRGKSQAPQALVTVRDNITNSVIVSGDVAEPGRQTLTLGGDRLLDAIARAGGLKGQLRPQSAIVRFARGGRSIDVPLDGIGPSDTTNIRLLPGDRVDVLTYDRTITVFGAAPRVGEIKLDARRLSLAEAVSRAGGPADQTADPSAVFVFRYPSADAVQPIVYRLNMLKPSSYFLAQRFYMRDKDVIYIANARANQARRLVEIVNLLVSPFVTANNIAR